jgi:hypothetical protein
VLSDFLNDGYFEQLSHLAKKHDVIGIKINDTLDEQIPNVGLIQIYDVEKQTHIWIDSNDKSWAATYQQSYQDLQKYFEQSFGRAGADKLILKSNQPYVSALMNFFKKR